MIKATAHIQYFTGKFLSPLSKFIDLSLTDQIRLYASLLGAILRKNQTKWEMENFEPPTKIFIEVGPYEGCSKMSIIEVIT